MDTEVVFRMHLLHDHTHLTCSSDKIRVPLNVGISRGVNLQLQPRRAGETPKETSSCIARNIKMHLYEKFILWEKRMNEGRPYLQMWRGVQVSFCKIAIVFFLSIRYKSDGLYCRVAGTPSSPTLFFIRVETSKMPVRCMKNQDLVGEKDERRTALSANVERSVGKLSQFPSYPLDIDRTAHIAGWQAHHHHQLCFFIGRPIYI